MSGGAGRSDAAGDATNESASPHCVAELTGDSNRISTPNAANVSSVAAVTALALRTLRR